MNNTEIQGLDELIRDLAAFGDEAMKELQPGINEAAEHVLKSARVKAPKGATRNLSTSLFLKKQATKNKMLYVKQLTWGDNVRAYGAPVELGHAIKFSKNGKVYGHVPPQPFLRPAADETKNVVFRKTVEAMDKALVKFAHIKG